MDLKENALMQVVGFFILMSTSAYFCLVFAGSPPSLENVSLCGTGWSGMVGVILFNFSLVLAIPAWLHSKKENVQVQQVVHKSTLLSTLLYIFVGALGASAIPHLNINMLKPMVSGAYGTGLQWMGSLFAFFIIELDIPVFSVMTRYNLVQSGFCTEQVANLIVVWIPWGASWIFYQGSAIADLLDWGGVLLTSAVAFLLPLYLALRVLIHHASDAQGSIAVYGEATSRMSRSEQIKWLKVLLGIAIVAVAFAIVGQLMAAESKSDYLVSDKYVNDPTHITSLKG